MLAKNHQEIMKRHLDFWNRKKMEKPIINVDYSLTNRFGHVPSLPREWQDKDGLFLEPEMLSPERLKAEPKAVCKSDPPVCGPIFNTAYTRPGPQLDFRRI